MNSYFILWPNSWCKLLAQANIDEPLQAFYGGPHTSVPPLGKVATGDLIYPVTVKDGQLFIIGRMRVERIKEADSYLQEQKVFKPDNELWDTAAPKILKQHPEIGHRIPRSCIDNVAVGTGTRLRFDFGLPTDLVTSLRFGPKAGQEKALNVTAEGKVSHISLQGHFRRLSAESAKLIEDTMRKF